MIETLDQLALFTLPFFIFIYFFFGLDDLFLDFIAWSRRLRPMELKKAHINLLEKFPEKQIAILIASWKEEAVLRKMIQGNLKRIQYHHFHIFLGVYPNDPATKGEAISLSNQFSNVHVVENKIEGPTSKGQLLNELVQRVFQFEKKMDLHFDLFLIHDSEDLLHPLSLKIINWEAERSDFVQLPIFSLPLKQKDLVAATYIDEFSEFHTKDILVRAWTGAAVPSAGVGTALTRHLVLNFLNLQNGNLLNPDSLTEDYELGLSTLAFGMKSKFACFFIRDENGKPEFIATRELFPKSFIRSIRQKTRWTFGIVFQGTEHLGWRGNFTQKYFLYRDRKGLFASILVIAGSSVTLYLGCRVLLALSFGQNLDQILNFSLEDKPFLLFAGTANLFLMMNRIFQRAFGVARLYGISQALLIPIRLPLTNIINALASTLAIKQYLQVKISGIKPLWAKTDHELPEGFGLDSKS